VLLLVFISRCVIEGPKVHSLFDSLGRVRIAFFPHNLLVFAEILFFQG